MYGELGLCAQMRLRLHHGYDDAEPLYLRKLLAGTLPRPHNKFPSHRPCKAPMALYGII